MLLLDTADLPAENPVACRAASGGASILCCIDNLAEDHAMHASTHLWPLGRATLLTSGPSGSRLVPTSQHVLQESPPALSLTVQSRGFRDVCAFQVPYDQLRLPADVVRAAGPRLRASPLYELVHDHLVRLAGLADVMAADPGAAAAGTATTELVRALLVSAAGRPGTELGEQTLSTRVLMYARQHLTEPGLTPQHIAGAHNVSVRQLYKACASVGVRLEQWVIEQRLEAARAELAAPSGRRRSIAATARACGFANPGHFSRRFRAAYGMTPRDWRRSSA
jgi:AraC-like DNA-binding protein